MGGTMFDYILEATQDFPFVERYVHGKMKPEEFIRQVDERADELEAGGLSPWAITLLRRFPPDRTVPAEKVLQELYRCNRISDPTINEQAFSSYQDLINTGFNHLPERRTSIFPEETKLAFALSKALHPSNIVVAGSFYLYFAVWFVPGMDKDGNMICLDVDQRVCELARQNIHSLHIQDSVHVLCQDAEAYLKSYSDTIDLLVLDAFGDRSNASRHHRGKAIYGPIIRAALPHLRKGSVIVAHNAEGNAHDLEQFYGSMIDAEHFIRAGTTENVGVYLL